MNNTKNETAYLANLNESEETEDLLDISHPEDHREAIMPNLQTLEQSRIALVVGHTRRSAGVLATAPLSDSEYFWNSLVAQRVAELASPQYIRCAVFFRDGIGIEGAYNKVRAWQAHTCIELHFNAFNRETTGTETLHGARPDSEVLAHIFQDEISNTFRRTADSNRGLKKRLPGSRGSKSLSQLVDTPSILVEPFYGDVESEARLATDVMESYALSIITAHQRFLNRFA